MNTTDDNNDATIKIIQYLSVVIGSARVVLEYVFSKVRVVQSHIRQKWCIKLQNLQITKKIKQKHFAIFVKKKIVENSMT